MLCSDDNVQHFVRMCVPFAPSSARPQAVYSCKWCCESPHIYEEGLQEEYVRKKNKVMALIYIFSLCVVLIVNVTFEIKDYSILQRGPRLDRRGEQEEALCWQYVVKHFTQLLLCSSEKNARLQRMAGSPLREEESETPVHDGSDSDNDEGVSDNDLILLTLGDFFGEYCLLGEVRDSEILN